jgi:hypothetical protein
MFLSIKPSLLRLVTLSPGRFGVRSFLIFLLILKNFLLQWTRGTITMMNRRTLGLAMHWLKRIRLSLSARSGLKLTGRGYLARGLQVLRSSSLTGMLSFGTIAPLSWIFSEPLQRTLLSLFHLMCMSATSIQRSLSILMIGLNSICRSLLRCSHHLHRQTPCVPAREPSRLKRPLPATFRSVWMCLAAIGALVRASLRSVQIAASMGSAVSAVKDTERKTTNNALLSSKLVTERELLGVQEDVTMFTEKGPCPLSRSPLKRKASVAIDPPRFCPGFVWSDNSIDLISPSALYTESAPPLPSPPQHLLDDPAIQESIHLLGDAIKVEPLLMSTSSNCFWPTIPINLSFSLS